MAHYARINAQGLVSVVIVAEQDFIDARDDSDAWVQTSYNTRGGKHYDPETGELSSDQSKALRKNYAGIGFRYDPERDAFIPPRPYASWSLDEDTCWYNAPYEHAELSEAEIEKGCYYIWDEDIHAQDNNQGWVLIDPSVL